MSSKAPKVFTAPSPYTPADWEVPDASAVQALVRGEATPEQQQRALNWIVYEACGTYDLEYRTDPRDHAFVSGRRDVGLQIVKLMKIATGKFVTKGGEQG